MVSYNKLEVTGSRFKKNILSGNMYWVWFKLPLLTLFNFKKLLSCLQVDDVTNYHAVEFCLGLSFNKTHSGGFIEKDSFLYCIGFLADFLNLQTEYY